MMTRTEKIIALSKAPGKENQQVNNSPRKRKVPDAVAKEPEVKKVKSKPFVADYVELFDKGDRQSFDHILSKGYASAMQEIALVKAVAKENMNAAVPDFNEGLSPNNSAHLEMVLSVDETSPAQRHLDQIISNPEYLSSVEERADMTKTQRELFPQGDIIGDESSHSYLMVNETSNSNESEVIPLQTWATNIINEINKERLQRPVCVENPDSPENKVLHALAQINNLLKSIGERPAVNRHKKTCDKENSGKIANDQENPEKIADDQENPRKIADDQENPEKIADDQENSGKITDDQANSKKTTDDKERDKGDCSGTYDNSFNKCDNENDEANSFDLGKIFSDFKVKGRKILGELPTNEANQVPRRTTWTEKEKEIVLANLGSHVTRGKAPGKQLCIKFIQECPVLQSQNRTWMQLNLLIDNFIRRKTKLPIKWAHLVT